MVSAIHKSSRRTIKGENFFTRESIRDQYECPQCNNFFERYRGSTIAICPKCKTRLTLEVPSWFKDVKYTTVGV